MLFRVSVKHQTVSYGIIARTFIKQEYYCKTSRPVRQISNKYNRYSVSNAFNEPFTFPTFFSGNNISLRTKTSALVNGKRTLCTSVPSLKVDIGCSSLQGRSKENEDQFDSKFFNENHLYNGVFDGHNGNFVSKFANVNLPLMIQERINEKQYALYENLFESVNDIMLTSFENCQRLLREKLLSTEDLRCKDMVGSTALVSLLIDQKYLIIANVGDSKAILCRDGKPLELSVEHNAENKEEAIRVQKCGGTIDWDTRMKPYVNSRLSITRSFGNLLLKEKGVISEPSISNITLDEITDAFLVLCSDGITHAISDEEIVFIISQHEKAIDAAEDLTTTAQQYGSTDDCTAIVVPLPAWRCVEVKMPTSNVSHFRTMTGGRSSG